MVTEEGSQEPLSPLLAAVSLTTQWERTIQAVHETLQMPVEGWQEERVANVRLALLGHCSVGVRTPDLSR